MKLLTNLFAFAGVVLLCNGLVLPDPSWAKQIKGTDYQMEYLLGDVGDNSTIDCHGRLYSCADCSTARVCLPNGDSLEHFMDQKCPAERPFCDNKSGTCQEQASLNCGKEDSFACTKNEHMFPDANCSNFHYCDVDFVSKLFECAIKGEVFDPEKQICQPGECGTFPCQGQAGRKVRHTLHSSYYALCSSDSPSVPLIIDQCPEFYLLNPVSQVCELECPHDGLFADAYNNKYYYRCHTVNYSDDISFMDKSREQCPEKTTFRNSQFSCV